MKLSLIKKRIGNKIKIGNLVYYISSCDGEKGYCIVQEIKKGKVYGYWQDTITGAKLRANDTDTGWMLIERCFNEI